MSFLDSFTTFSDATLGLLLIITVLSLWNSLSTPLLAGGTCLLALLTQRIDWIGLASLIFMALIIKEYYQDNNARWKKVFLGLLMLMGIPLFYLHIIPGFYNLCLMDKVRLCADCIPYSSYLNTDKILIGTLLLSYSHHHFSRSFKEWKRTLQDTIIPLCFVVCVLLIGATLFNYIRVDFKVPSIIIPWMIVNLLFVCTAEEAFFRGFIQKELSLAFQSIKGGSWIALGIASVLFGCAHYQGGIVYVILAALAGMGYGYVYQRSNKIESSIFLHFLVNLIHFIGFSYPALTPVLALK